MTILQPTGNYVFIQLKDANKSDLALPQGTRLKPYGIVLAAGPDCRVPVGSKVHFLPGSLIGYDESDATCFIAEPSILGIYPDEND